MAASELPPVDEQIPGKDSAPSQDRLSRFVISLFIIFYISAITLWISPWSRAKQILLEPVSDQIYFMGAWQGFGVFAPDPRTNNIRIYATITYDDGTSTIWHYPSMEKLGYLERYCREHYRKFGNDCLNSTELLWRDFARFVARKHDRKNKHPLTVSLTRTWSETPPIEEGLGKPNPEQSNKYRFYLYRVVTEDLQ